MMINMELDANTAEDWKIILELQKMGIPDEAIQIAYDNTVRKRKEKNGIIQEECRGMDTERFE